MGDRHDHVPPASQADITQKILRNQCAAGPDSQTPQPEPQIDGHRAGIAHRHRMYRFALPDQSSTVQDHVHVQPGGRTQQIPRNPLQNRLRRVRIVLIAPVSHQLMLPQVSRQIDLHLVKALVTQMLAHADHRGVADPGKLRKLRHAGGDHPVRMFQDIIRHLLLRSKHLLIIFPDRIDYQCVFLIHVTPLPVVKNIPLLPVEQFH